MNIKKINGNTLADRDLLPPFTRDTLLEQPKDKVKKVLKQLQLIVSKAESLRLLETEYNYCKDHYSFKIEH